MKKWFKRILISLFIIFIIISIIPYLVPIKTNTIDNSKPFAESKYQDINNIKIHYRTWLPKDTDIKGKVLMVHGLGGSTFSWRNNISDLVDKGYMVVAVDLPGFGYSDKSAGIDHSQENRSKMLWSLLDNLDLSVIDNSKDLNWTLIGHSMGGGTVTAMAIDQPSKTDSIVLVSGALFDNSPKFVSSVIFYPPVKRGLKVALGNYIINYKNIENYLSSAYGRAPNKEEVLGYLKPLRDTGPLNFIGDLLLTARSEPVEGLRNSDVHVLYVAGEKDTWVPKEQAVTLKKIVPRVDIITIKNASHCSMETAPDEFNNILDSFLTK